MKIIFEGGQGEIVEKKSRFIATIIPIETEEEALEFIQAKKKEYWDARHNCSAYIIGETNPLMRCSDDGEPAQTAGRPMLDVLINQNITNVCVVVTRYFGGVLLGTGGLVRAYQGAVIEGLSKCTILERQKGIMLSLNCDYNMHGKLEYLFRNHELPVESEFSNEVVMKLCVPIESKDAIEKEIINLSSGTVAPLWGDEVLFANSNGRQILL